MTSGAVLQVRDLWKRYPARRAAPTDALQGVCLEARAGECLALIGPNGSGKSTLLRILAGILLPSEGSATVGDCDVVTGRPRVRALVGLAQGDDRGLSSRLTVRQNLRFFGALYGVPTGEAAQRVSGLAERLECTHLLDRPVRTLSSGERARAALVRALLHRPALLLLDELTRSLDPGAGDRIRAWIRAEAARTGLCVLLATHDLGEVASTAQHVALLEGGRMAALGPWADIQGTAQAVFARAGAAP